VICTTFKPLVNNVNEPVCTILMCIQNINHKLSPESICISKYGCNWTDKDILVCRFYPKYAILSGCVQLYNQNCSVTFLKQDYQLQMQQWAFSLRETEAGIQFKNLCLLLGIWSKFASVTRDIPGHRSQQKRGGPDWRLIWVFSASFPSPPLHSLPLEVAPLNPAMEPGEHHKFPQWDPN